MSTNNTGGCRRLTNSAIRGLCAVATELVLLDLRGLPLITDACIEPLTEGYLLPKLAKLCLLGCPGVSEACVERLRQSRPQLVLQR